MLTKLPKQEWFYVGLVERISRRKGRRLTYLWENGYSTHPKVHHQPWLTRREACAQAQRDGFRASFVRTNSITT